MSLTNFRAEDFESAGKKPAKKAAKKAPAKKAEAPAPAPEPAADAVPEGSVDEVTAWVGQDKERAARALEAEKAKDKPRKTAVAELEAILDGAGEK